MESQNMQNLFFSSNVRIGKPLDYLNIDKMYSNSSMADIIGTVLFDPNYFEIKYLKKDKKNKKNLGFSGFFAWLDQYI